MKNVFVLFSVFVLSCSLIGQPVFKKQISFLDFDGRNPSFITTNMYDPSTILLFEGYKDPTAPQIFFFHYDLAKDSFFSPTQITFSKGSCINPSGNFTMGAKIIWQTNEKGNWDIACGELLGDSLKEVQLVANDSIDEINPRLILSNYHSDYVFGFTYEKAGSIFLYYEIDTLKVTEKIFNAEGVDSYEYENASGAFWKDFVTMKSYQTVVAVKRIQNGERRIVYRMKEENSELWSEEKYLYDSVTTVCSPSLNELFSAFFTMFETITDGKRSLKFFGYPSYFGNPEFAENVSDSTYETLNFSMRLVPVMTRSLAKSFRSLGQSIYQIRKDRKNYLRPSYYNEYVYSLNDSLTEIKLSEPKITTENVGFKFGDMVAYSVWEDSSDNGTIQLFGSSGVYDIGGIEDETSPQDFTLYQNYPNPFNPETVISFQLSVNSKVSLKVFDVLGREIATLINEEKPAGEYQVLFNNQLTPPKADNRQLLSSGVLFYQLMVGNRLQTKSMLLLK
ncbi:MAG: T9SS type A sorting domain-containing protein [Ignavibacteriaceae bacterium]|jgi:hypothetical protein